MSMMWKAISGDHQQESDRSNTGNILKVWTVFSRRFCGTVGCLCWNTVSGLACGHVAAVQEMCVCMVITTRPTGA